MIISYSIVLQVRVRARDGGMRFTDAVLTVSVNRNLHAPRFEPASYQTELLDNEPLASSFLTLSVRDDDAQVSGRPRASYECREQSLIF